MDKNVRVPLAVVSAALVVGILGWFGWRWYTAQPHYALSQIRSAIQDSNRLRFERYVDVDRFAQDVVDEILEGALQLSLTDLQESGWAALGSLLGQKLAEGLKPSLVTALRSSITKAVDEGNFSRISSDSASTSNGDSVSAVRVVAKSGVGPETFEGVGKIERERDRAYVPLRFREQVLDTVLVVRLDMRKESGVWRVVGVEDLAEYLTTIKELRERTLEAANSEILASLRSMLTIHDFSRSEIGESFFGPEYLRVRYRVTNRASDTVETALIRVRLPKEANEHYLNMAVLKAIPPGKTGSAENYLDYNPFVTWHKVVREVSPAKLSPETVFLVVRRDQQSDTVKILESWEDYVRRR